MKEIDHERKLIQVAKNGILAIEKIQMKEVDVNFMARMMKIFFNGMIDGAEQRIQEMTDALLRDEDDK